MISIELLREVLKNDLCSYESIESVQGIDEIYENMFKYTTDENTSPLDGSYIDTMREINVYELAFKCKKKAKELGFDIDSSLELVEVINHNGEVECTLPCDLEPFGVFEALEWILKNK